MRKCHENGVKNILLCYRRSIQPDDKLRENIDKLTLKGDKIRVW
jgi:hypothetical protein